MSSKFALIIGNTEYIDPGLAQLTAPGKDTEDFARVLKDHDIGAFDEVNILLNQPEPVVRGAIDEFFDQKKPDDLLVLYFSGHGVRDELGALYLAVKNTVRARLRSTAIKSDYIREAMDQSRSRRQVLILDCCNSGAYAQGTKAATGVSIGTASAFEAGYGRIILTASDSTQFAWEGDKVIGNTDNSLFTHYLIEGLEGEADLDGDGHITVDELYDYAYEKVRLATPKQTPSKFSSKQQGEIILRQSMRIEDIKPVALSAELMDEIEDTRPYVREAAVRKLEKIIRGKNLGLARSAREALENIVKDENTTRRVAQAATQALEAVHQTEQLAHSTTEKERSAREKAAVEQKTEYETQRLAAQKVQVKPLARERDQIKQQLPTKPMQDAAARKKAMAGKPWSRSAMPILGGIVALLILGGTVWLVTRHTDTASTPQITSTITNIPNIPIVLTSTPISPTSGSPKAGENRENPKDESTLIYIPPGEFTMGLTVEQIDQLQQLCNTQGCEELYQASKPDHMVTLTNGYWIYRTEVSNAQYAKCDNDEICEPPGLPSSRGRENYYKFPDFDNYPVVWVDWDQADNYCQWAGGRLPTSAEWEYAARGNDKRLFPWGNDFPIDSQANVDRSFGDTEPVDKFAEYAGLFGLLNMTGNVWEWVNDWYSSSYYQDNTNWINPTGPLGPSSDNLKVGRGGSWEHSSVITNIAIQDWYARTDDGDGVGFRCVIDIP